MKDLEIIIGWECNNNCIFCSNPEMKKIMEEKKIPKIDIDLIKNILKKEDPKKIDTLFLVGGEPTIIKGLFEIIRFAITLGFKRIFLMTNGRMLSNISFLKKIMKYPQIEIGISIHSPEEKTHDALTRTQGSFKQTVKGIENLNKTGKKFMTNTVITKKNYKELPTLIKMLSEYNPSIILLSFPFPKGKAKENFNEIIPRYSEIKEKIIETLELGKKLNQNVKTLDIPACILGNYSKQMHENEITKERFIITHAFDEIIYGKNYGREKIKSEFCKQCKLFKNCEGVWKEYAKIFGFDELNPIEDKRC